MCSSLGQMITVRVIQRGALAFAEVGSACFSLFPSPPNTGPDSSCSINIVEWMNKLKLSKCFEFLSTLKMFAKCFVLIILKDCVSSDLLMQAWDTIDLGVCGEKMLQCISEERNNSWKIT